MNAFFTSFLSILQVILPLLFAAGMLMPLILGIILYWREKHKELGHRSEPRT